MVIVNRRRGAAVQDDIALSDPVHDRCEMVGGQFLEVRLAVVSGKNANNPHIPAS
jgi:hypothetical protein